MTARSRFLWTKAEDASLRVAAADPAWSSVHIAQSLRRPVKAIYTRLRVLGIETEYSVRVAREVWRAKMRRRPSTMEWLAKVGR